MALDIMHVEYYNITVENQITNASKLISTIADADVDFHAFKSIPLNPNQTQVTFFAKDGSKMRDVIKKSELKLNGPYTALLIKGDEKPGALAGIYKKLSMLEIQVDEACGIADINGGYGVILYLSKKDLLKALTAFEM